jgi:NAD-dependent protein deacetylase/lipoamidase
VREAERVAVLTGAGISAESGVPTFRGPDGLWRKFRAEQLATPEAFARDPKLVWEWYDSRRAKLAALEPNAGHLALVELERRKKSFTLITQNVDGLHDRAGSRNVLKLHGDIWTVRCGACGNRRRDERAHIEELPPRCACGGMERPGVVWFGEPLPADELERSVDAAGSAEVFLVVGTSATVYPAAALIPLAQRAGAKVIEVNTETTPVSGMADASLRGASAGILSQLIL